jgi:hypothetical protein
MAVDAKNAIIVIKLSKLTKMTKEEKIKQLKENDLVPFEKIILTDRNRLIYSLGNKSLSIGGIAYFVDVPMKVEVQVDMGFCTIKSINPLEVVKDDD